MTLFNLTVDAESRLLPNELANKKQTNVTGKDFLGSPPITPPPAACQKNVRIAEVTR